MEFVQNDIFSELYPKFTITKPIRLIELFAGIGSQAKALKNLGANFEHWKAVEFDKYAMASYNAIHGTHFEVSDIRNVHAADLDLRERERFCYIMTYSFPCQDLSVAGLQKGMKKGSGTRSGLLWEVERILDECGENLPHILLMENVPAVLSEKNIEDFYAWRGKLETLGYSSYAQILNAKDYGIPQNRARCFMVSILGEYSYGFPKPQKLNLVMKDLLEKDVDESYYINSESAKKFLANNLKNAELDDSLLRERERESAEQLELADSDHLTATDGESSLKEFYEVKLAHGWNPGSIKKKDVASTIATGVSKWWTLMGETGGVKEVGYIEKGSGKHQSNMVYDPNGLARTMQSSDYKAPMKVIVDEEE